MWPDASILVSSGVAALEAGQDGPAQSGWSAFRVLRTWPPCSASWQHVQSGGITGRHWGTEATQLGNPEPELLGHLPVSTCSLRAPFSWPASTPHAHCLLFQKHRLSHPGGLLTPTPHAEFGENQPLDWVSGPSKEGGCVADPSRGCAD